jgi:hypothetical protein
MWDWGYLVIVALALVLSWWPVGAWHLWSWMWLTILLVVLIFEVIGKFFSPEKSTISNQMRKYRQQHPIMFWAVQILLWLGFAYALTAHLAT